jgi:hypothetical protein
VDGLESRPRASIGNETALQHFAARHRYFHRCDLPVPNWPTEGIQGFGSRGQHTGLDCSFIGGSQRERLMSKLRRGAKPLGRIAGLVRTQGLIGFEDLEPGRGALLVDQDDGRPAAPGE